MESAGLAARSLAAYWETAIWSRTPAFRVRISADVEWFDVASPSVQTLSGWRHDGLPGQRAAAPLLLANRRPDEQPEFRTESTRTDEAAP